jgi:hypothetical protein
MFGQADVIAFARVKKLHAAGIWSQWLNAEELAQFQPYLANVEKYDAFMDTNNTTQADLRLQLRVRAVLFDPSLSLCSKQKNLNARLAALLPRARVPLNPLEVACSINDINDRAPQATVGNSNGNGLGEGTSGQDRSSDRIASEGE